MKNIIEKRKRYNARHSEKELARRLEYQKYRRHKNRFPEVFSTPSPEYSNIRIISEHLKYTKVRAPEVFSMVENYDECVLFINRLEELLEEGKKTFVVMKEVKTIGYDALVVLLSIMVNFKTKNVKFNGDFPINNEARDLVEKSGFLKNLYEPIKNNSKYILKGTNDGIFTHAYRDVDSELGDRLISEASKRIWGEERRCQGVQRTLLELMQNTNNHASEVGQGDKHWWLSVSHSDKKAYFAFVDYGVGVFRSLMSKSRGSKFYGWFDIMKSLFSFSNNAELLKLILEGELHKTVTKSYFRGKGLPGIKEALARNQISNLYIITNDVYADVGKGEYKIMRNEFKGTFVFWELNETNRSCHA